MSLHTLETTCVQHLPVMLILTKSLYFSSQNSEEGFISPVLSSLV